MNLSLASNLRMQTCNDTQNDNTLSCSRPQEAILQRNSVLQNAIPQAANILQTLHLDIDLL